MILGSQYEKNLGEDIGNILNIEDEIYDFEITPNRPDCLGILGIANELKCAVNRKEKQDILIKKGEYEKYANILSEKENIDNIGINIESDDVKRYLMIPLYNIKRIETPNIIKERLKTMGVNSKGDILVDISNYIMFETGNPTHIFDLDILKEIAKKKNNDNKVILYISNNSKNIELLNEENIELSDDLTISIEDENLALVGIMGGRNSGVNENTKNILIEIATFERKKIRDTSRKYNIRTESSTRFEKKLSPRLPELAFLRMIKLMKELGVIDEKSFKSGKINVIDYKREDIKNKLNEEENDLIKFDSNEINKILGTDISEKEMIDILTDIGFEKYNGKKDILIKPYVREDISRKQDLAEEVIRFYGYDKLGETLPKVERGNIFESNDKDIVKISKKIRNILKIEGYNQIITYRIYIKRRSFKIRKNRKTNRRRKCICFK